ncbi:MAG: STAS domain-containing protein [Candidatus Omnitrophota bacterium]
MSLNVEIKKQKKDTYVVALSGRLDSDTYIDFGEKLKTLLNPSTKTLIFDMIGLEYISSIGLGVIFKARSTIESAGGKIHMVGLQPQIKKIFEVVKALPKEPVFDSMKEVDEYLDRVQKQELEKQEG